MVGTRSRKQCQTATAAFPYFFPDVFIRSIRLLALSAAYIIVSGLSFYGQLLEQLCCCLTEYTDHREQNNLRLAFNVRRLF